MKKVWVVIVLLCLAASGSFAKKSSTEIVHVLVLRCHDGDTCTANIDRDGLVPPEKIKIRFAGIDAPEAKQAEGQKARAALEGRIKGKPVRLECRGKSYDRRTCTVYLGSENINFWMVDQGWAWDSPQYSKGKYAEAQSRARTAGRGIWATPQAHQQSPYCFRHRKAKACRAAQNFNP